MNRTVKKIVALSLLVAFSALPAHAHPHVWVVAHSTVLFDKDGRVTGVKHDWTFDEMYSAFATTGLGANGKPPTREELAPLAKTNVESLAEFDYFTFAKEAGKNLAFDEPVDYWLDADDKKIVSLHFTLPLKQPLQAKKPFSYQVYDPTYFVAFDLQKKDPVALQGAPSGCSVSVIEPPPLLASDTQKLSQAKTDNFSPGADLAIKLAPRAVVACP